MGEHAGILIRVWRDIIGECPLRVESEPLTVNPPD